MSARISRRTILRGLGAAIALPALEATWPTARAAAGEAAPARLVGMFFPNGNTTGDPSATWVPTATGAGWVAPPGLAGLAPVRSHVRVLTGLDNADLTGDHAVRMRSAWSPVLGLGDDGLPVCGPSLDTLVAPALAGSAPLDRLVLASEGAVGCQRPDCFWNFHLSWSTGVDPTPRQLEPAGVFERLFGMPDGQGLPSVVRRATRASVLDSVTADAHALSARLGAEDRARLDDYLTAIRGLERRLTAAPADDCPAEAPGVPADPQAHVAAMLDLIVLALRCDRVRTVSYMPAVAQSYRRLDFLGYDTDHHLASHQQPEPHTAATAWYVGRYAALVGALDAAVLPDGSSLLDHTVVTLHSEIGDGPTHGHTELPVLVAGRPGTDDLAPVGAHTRLPAGTPVHAAWAGLQRDLTGAASPDWGAPLGSIVRPA
ncbi:MAG: DUF1552 domain-containing protein [Alphaproteobacteria bacterium]|nr:DUF1552 domain-containing protein [Alphaproteobacteria bacterium]